MMRVVLCSVLFVSLACGPHLSAPQMWAIPEPIAVGARTDALVLVCRDEFNLGEALIGTVSLGIIVGLGRFDAVLGLPAAWAIKCRPVEVTVESVRLEGDAFSLQSATNAAVTTLLADHAGTSTLTIEGQAGGQHFSVSHTFEARVADHIEVVSLLCPKGSLVGRGATFPVKATLFDGTQALAGYGYLPLVEEGLTRVTSEPLQYRVDSQTDVARVRSSLDGSLVLDLTVIDATKFDHLEVVTKLPEQGPYPTQLQTVYLSATSQQRAWCAGTMTATVSIDTPSVCNGLTDAPFPASSDFLVRPLAGGQCRGTVTLDGTALSATFDFTVHPGWRLVPIADGFRAQAVWGRSPSDLYVGGTLADAAVIEHFDGVSWSPTMLAAGTGIQQLHGTSASQVLALTTSGLLFAFDGTKWVSLRNETNARAFGVGSSGPTDVWALTGTAVEHFDGHSWATSVTPSLFGAITAIAPDDAWAVSAQNLFHWNGSVWTNETPTGQNITLEAIGSAGKNAVWAVGNGGGLHFDGTHWLDWSASNPSCMQSVSVLDASTVFAANCNGRLYPVVMQTPTMQYPQSLTAPFPNDSLFALWVHTAHDVFGLGGAGLYHWEW